MEPVSPSTRSSQHSDTSKDSAVGRRVRGAPPSHASAPAGELRTATGTWWRPQAFTKDLVSIVIPTRNRTRYIRETLASILAQTYDKIEVVVADDGSTDHTPAVLAEWQARFLAERGWTLRILRQPQKGVSAARNLAAQHSRGEMIKFFDDDDLMADNLIAAQVQLMK
ncbi:MAG: glycosyltransferase family 2 protein, partial [Planctomycetota bacterium]